MEALQRTSFFRDQSPKRDSTTITRTCSQNMVAGKGAQEPGKDYGQSHPAFLILPLILTLHTYTYITPCGTPGMYLSRTPCCPADRRCQGTVTEMWVVGMANSLLCASQHPMQCPPLSLSSAPLQTPGKFNSGKRDHPRALVKPLAL